MCRCVMITSSKCKNVAFLVTRTAISASMERIYTRGHRHLLLNFHVDFIGYIYPFSRAGCSSRYRMHPSMGAILCPGFITSHVRCDSPSLKTLKKKIQSNTNDKSIARSCVPTHFVCFHIKKGIRISPILRRRCVRTSI